MYSEIAANKRKSIIVMLLFIIVIAALVALVGIYFGRSLTIFYGGLIGAAIYTVITYFAGARMSLAVNGAREIQKSDNPRLWRIVENLSITDGIPMPRVFIMDDPSPNAFATGRDPKHAAVCATSGILEIMNDTELEGVFAHELGHVKNYDIRVSMIAFALTAAISLIADIILHMAFFRNDNNNNNGGPLLLVAGLIAAIVAPIIAAIIQSAVSRQREYLADATGALTTRYPEGLASALEKIATYGRPMQKQNTATAHLFFANPLKGSGITKLFSTHPPIEERIARLRGMTNHA
ncbi:M48 family metalloprotease [Candidatus Saccharibacteria bacterium]|nr:M48 family metalloprotease [Candidatus Saccharibacteria bacterium]